MIDGCIVVALVAAGVIAGYTARVAQEVWTATSPTTWVIRYPKGRS